MKLITNSWTILDYLGKNSKDNAFEPNLIADLQQIATGLEDINDKNLKDYIEYFYPAIHAHVFIKFIFLNKVLFYSHLLWGDMHISESFIDFNSKVTHSFLITNSTQGGLFLENPQKIAEYNPDVIIYAEKEHQSNFPPEIYEKQLKIFGIVDPTKSRKITQSTQQTTAINPLISKLSSLFFGSINTESNLFEKEPNLVYYEDYKSKNRILTYNFSIRSLNYFSSPTLLSNILKIFCV